MNPNAEDTISVEHNILKRSYIAAGATLIVSSVIALALAMHHPVIHGSPREFADFQLQIASVESYSAWVHGLLILMLLVFTNGQHWLRKAHGENRFLGLLGVSSYASGAVFASMAAATSGFILPAVIAGINSDDQMQTAMGQQIIGMLNDARDAFHHFSIVGITIGIAFLACVLFAARHQVGMALSGSAVAVGALACIALVTRHMEPNVHGVLVFATFLALWNLVAAFILIRKARSIEVMP